MALQPYYASQHRASTSALVPSSYSHQNPWFYQVAPSAGPSTVHDNGMNAAGPSRYIRGDAVAFRHKSATIRPPYQYVNNINAPPASSSSSSTPSSSDYDDDDDSEDEDSETDASSVAPEPPAKPSKSSSQVVLVPFRESHPQSAFSPLSSRSAHSGGPYSNNTARQSALSRSATDLSSHLVSARSRTISLAAASAAASAPAPARSVVGSTIDHRVQHRHVEPPQPPHSLHRRSNTVSHVSAPPSHRSAFRQVVQVQAPPVHLAPPAIMVSEQQQMYNYVHAMQSLERVADVDPRLLSRPASPARKPSLVRRIAQAWRGRRRTLERVRFESVIPGSPNYNGSSGPFELDDEEEEEDYSSEVGTHFEHAAAAPHVVGMAYSQTGYRRARIVIE